MNKTATIALRLFRGDYEEGKVHFVQWNTLIFIWTMEKNTFPNEKRKWACSGSSQFGFFIRNFFALFNRWSWYHHELREDRSTKEYQEKKKNKKKSRLKGEQSNYRRFKIIRRPWKEEYLGQQPWQSPLLQKEVISGVRKTRCRENSSQPAACCRGVHPTTYKSREFLRDPTLHLAAPTSLLEQHGHLRGPIRNYQVQLWTNDTKSYGYSNKLNVLRIIFRPEAYWPGAAQSVLLNACPPSRLHIWVPRGPVSNLLNIEFIFLLTSVFQSQKETDTTLWLPCFRTSCLIPTH